MKLYTYSRSTTAYRVRAALNLKGLAYDAEPVNLVSGEQRTADYRALNPAKGVPTLVLDDGTVLTQSIAIIEYLDTLAPTPPMLSQDPLTRARMQAVVMSIATDIHPVNNLRVVQHLKNGFGASADQCQGWMQHWMKEGFAATEALLPDSGGFAWADTPGLADLCVTAQVYNARRWEVDLTPFPKIEQLEQACLAIPAIAAAHPDKQSDTKDAS